MKPFFHEFHNNDHDGDSIGLSLAMQNQKFVREVFEEAYQFPLIALHLLPHLGIEYRLKYWYFLHSN